MNGGGISVEQAGVALSLVVSLVSLAYSYGVNAARVEGIRVELAGLSKQIEELRGMLFRAIGGGK